MSFTIVEVTGTLQGPDTTPIAEAWLQFSLTNTITSIDDGSFITATAISTQTDVNGNWSVSLVATDDSTTTPKGQVYKVEIETPAVVAPFVGSAATGTYFPDYYFALPAAAAPTVNLAQLISSAPIPTYLGPTGPTGPTGP